MKVFGYQVCTARYARKEQDDTFVPYFGISIWSYCNPAYKSIPHPTKKFRKLRQLIRWDKGLYLHLWLFSYRFDLDFHKRIPA